MCFYIHSKHPDPKIAEEDKTCYKYGLIIGETLRSYHQGFYYKFNKTYSLKEKLTGSSAIYEGFHSITNKKQAIAESGKEYVVKCIIPKGATYYYNPDLQEYVSNKIKILKPI